MQSNRDISQNTTSRGMNKDLLQDFIPEGVYSHARNAILYSGDGEQLSIQTEQSTLRVTDLPYPLMGRVKLPDGDWCLFLSDDVSSEIGTWNEQTFVYTPVLNKTWLNFNRGNIITGASKENPDGTFQVYWADERRNLDRTLNLSKASQATYDSIRYAKLISPPSLSLNASTSGSLENGKYQAAIRYAINRQPFGEVYSLTLPEHIFHEDSVSGSLTITIGDTDPDFQQYELILIQTADNTTTVKSLGFYPSKQRKVTVSNFDSPSYEGTELSELTTQNPPVIASDAIYSTNEYLFRKGTEYIPELNYQLQANEVNLEYTVIQAPEDHYTLQDDPGHYRDEGYLPFIHWLHKTGSWSSAFPLGMREPTPAESAIASGNDVYEALLTTCDEPVVKRVWEVSNTASRMTPLQNPQDLVCDTKLVGYGTMGYYESTDLYPDNPTYGKWADKPIVIPTFPDEEKCPRYSVIQGKNYINILGWRFTNIQHPLKDGKPDTDWVGYRVIRSSREGSRRVLSRFMLTNVRSYQEKQGSEDVTVMYTNYPLNDLRPDSFISRKQTYWKNNGEHDFQPLTDYYTDRFTAWGPHLSVSRYQLGSELRIESEEVAMVDGQFTPVYRHPRQVLPSLFSFWIAAAFGSAQALLTTLGKNSYTSESELSAQGVSSGPKHQMYKTYRIESIEDLIGLDLISFTKDNILAGKPDALTTVKNVLLLLTSAGLKLLSFSFLALKAADQIIDVIYNFLKPIDYTLQYNCHALFNQSKTIATGFKRRFISKYQYLQSGLQTIQGELFNNNLRPNTVFLHTNQSLSPLTTTDNTRQTLREFGVEGDLNQKTSSVSSAYYATSRNNLPNQYGRIENNTSFLVTHNGYFPAIPEDANTRYSTTPILGGDCYINRYTQLNPFQFFSQNLSNSNAPDNEPFDYRLYPSIGRPRFWANFFRYDFSELLSKDIGEFSSFSNTVASRHNLDNKGRDDTNVFRVDDAYFYLSNNGVLDFFVESDFNLDLREKPKTDTHFYSRKFSTLPEIFRSDRLGKPEEFNYDLSYSHLPSEVFATPQREDYNPITYDRQYKYNKNRLVYSLPAFSEQQYDNWQYFLAANQYTFPLSQFGDLVSLHRLDSDRILFLFSRSSPYILNGRSLLQLSNQTVTIGDGGLFAQAPTEMMHTEQNYGSCQSRHASATTPFGTFYPSERQGRWISLSNNLDDLTRNGLQMWSKQYMPLQLPRLYPQFPHTDNPIVGVGYTMSTDATWDILYLSKRDYSPIYPADTTYRDGTWYYKDIPTTLSNPDYFNDLSVTLSYSPALKAFMGFHDWVPDFTIPTENHFVTSRGTSLYLHNSNPFSYCNYYGTTYPHEVTLIQSNKLKTNILQSIEYYLNNYRHKDSRNKSEIQDYNYDRAWVQNDQQFTGLLTLHPQTNPYEEYLYPKPNVNGMDILYSKVENRYRINQLFDITRDRSSDNHLVHIQPNGFHQMVNPLAIDPNKPTYERKNIRSTVNHIMLSREQPADVQMVLKLLLGKTQDSIR